MQHFETDKWLCLFALLVFTGGVFYGFKIDNSDMATYFSHSAELFSGALLTLMLNKKSQPPPADPPKENTN